MSDISLSKAVRSNLLSLQNTASMMSKTQERLATGNKVNSALDNPSNFFTASSLNSRAADMSNLLDSMASGIKVIEAANNGLTALTKNLESMQSTLRQARQDKSFQTKSFDVTADSVISLAGGQFGNIGETVSLATATIAGEKSTLTTTATKAYTGPAAEDGKNAGAGARSVMKVDDGFTVGDKFTVAGAEVTLTSTDADEIATDIRIALQNKADTKDKYSVTVGTEGTTLGRVIIETLDTNAPAATVNLDPDNNPLTGVDAAKKATTTFNYSSVTSNIQAGGKDIPTGSTFEQFTANLKAGEKEGNYTVTWDADTKDITLTATTHGAQPPEVIGVAHSKPEVAGDAAKTEFTLAATGSSPNKTLTHEQDLTFGGITDVSGSVALEAGWNKTQIQDAILEHLGGEDSKFTVAVDDNLKVTLTEKTNGGLAAPTVSSSQIAAPATASYTDLSGGLDFVGGAADTNLMTLAGTQITLTSGSDTVTVTIGDGNNDTVQEFITNLSTANFLVEADADGGFTFSRLDGKDFTIASTGDQASLGLGASTVEVTNGTQAQTNGITGGVAASLAGLDGADLQVNSNVAALAGMSIELDTNDGNAANNPKIDITVTTTSSELVNALSQFGFKATVDSGEGLTIERPDGTNFTMKITGGPSEGLGFATTSITSDNGEPPAVSQNPGVAFEAAVVGQDFEYADAGVEVETYEALKHEFTVAYDGKEAKVSIGSIKGGADSADFNDLDVSKWQAKTIASVNQQLEAKGITGVEGKFDADGKFSLVAKTAEAKSLSIVGNDAVDLFGANAVHTGRAEKSELNATKTVDKFVELINRDHGSKVRASNDNGKLRIENLSTQALDLGVDTTGNDVVNALKIEGNSVRDNLHKQFNELRDQLDKLSDDASFNGINLLRGDKLTITFNESGSSSIDIQSKDKSDQARAISASNLGVDSLVAMDLDSDEGIDAFLGKISSALSDIRSQASAFGSNLSSVENRQTFTKSMINTLQTGAANLTLADMNEEAANLLALQTRQSLSSSALSMASQADQSILQLLR
jgi:predicted HicB family RNase H-like nuclease